MKKLILLFFGAVFAVGSMTAQQPVNPPGDRTVAPNPCSIVVTGDFDPECMYSFKELYVDEYPDMMIACKHSTVTYTAYTYTGTATVFEYIWEIFGDVSHTATGDHCTVNWSDDEWGMVVVTIVTAEGDTCTESRHVKLIDNPTVDAVTIPAYTVASDGTKVIRVCKGMPVVFIDRSDAAGSDIAGIHWESTHSLVDPSSTPTYTMENVYMDCRVKHRVYNNCGCYDEEEFMIEVLTGEILELECYGTVCEGSVVEYNATAPPCSEYYWYVEGGTIIGGQGTDHPVVQWDHPMNGYGVIGLDGYLCGDEACPAMMSKRVPVIQNHLAIDGLSDVCTGDAVVYTLPLFGATKYMWSITPATGVDNTMIGNTNEARIVFHQAGSYTLKCSYQCDFLGCGPYDAEELSITVRPQLSITGNNRICISNACSLQTVPSVTATWTAYDLGNNNVPVGTPATGTVFSQIFSHAGRYLVTAENSAWCGPATFVLEVMDVPPAPTIADLDPANRHTACPWQGIALNGTPSEQNYNLVWEPACSTASPQQFSGDSVTISYQSDVCDVWVFNYDMVLQCKSSNHYVHHVTALTPAPLSLPTPIHVCPGTEIDWTAAVPDQRGDGMLYEWSILPNTKQYCASVQGSHLVPGVTLAVNEIATPDQFSMNLRRTYCGVYTDTSISITVYDTMPVTLAISGPSPLCRYGEGTYIGSNSGGYTATYNWEIEGDSYTGTPVSHTFMDEGSRTVMLYCNPFTYCTDKSHYNHKGKVVTINPLPPAYGVGFSGYMAYVKPTSLASPAYSFYWTVRATPSSPETYIGNTPSVSVVSQGIYSCTVTDNSTGCTWTVYEEIPDENSHACDEMSIAEDAYDVCTHTSTLAAQRYNPEVSWGIEQGNCTIDEFGTNNRYANVTFGSIGTHIITAQVGDDPCYVGIFTKTVDFIPDFEFVQECHYIKIINHSKYAQPGGTVYINVAGSHMPTPESIHFPVSQETYNYLIPVNTSTHMLTYTFTLTGYGSANGNMTPCTLGSITFDGHSLYNINDPVTITSANPYNNSSTCDNTPIELTATLNSSWVSVASTRWDFDDGSGYTTQGNMVFHTFEYPGNSPYDIIVTVIDNHGCTWEPLTPFIISSAPNNIQGGLLYTNNLEVCPFFNSRDIQFSPQISTNHYYWWRHKAPTHVPHGTPYPTYLSDDYFTYVINNNYCQAEATIFVKFKNAPTAHIYTENLNCCVGDEVRLYGETGPGSAPVLYSWSVTGMPATGTDPTFEFTPIAAGTYTITLTVTNSSTLCSSTTSETITVHPQPAAPTLTFVGNACISNAPVELTATGCSGEVHWSNGTMGSNALYFIPGVVSAYCFDPTIGCNSDTANITIVPQPDLDALLTGCYEKCTSQGSGYVPLYSLAAYMRRIWYSWNYPGGISSGYYTNDGHPLLLPYTFGDHYLTAAAPDPSCPRTSPVLRITGKEVCDCDSIDVIYTIVPTVSECTISYRVNITICNRSTTKEFCIKNLDVLYPQGNATVTFEDLTGSTVTSNDCDNFVINLDVSTFIPSEMIIRLTDEECGVCTKDFVIDLKTGIGDCVGEMELDIENIDYELSSDVAAYFDFYASLTSSNLLAFWSEPPMVVNYNQYGSTIQGLGMIDMSTLTRLMAEDLEVCFYAIVCEEDKICKERYCISADDLYDLISEQRVSPDVATGRRRTTVGSPQLKPNPTTGEVNVVGAADEVVEVLVMDMYGKKIATFDKTANFCVSMFSSGMYIVRVKTRGHAAEKVTYLKLVKR